MTEQPADVHGIPVETLRNLISYDPATGDLTWKRRDPSEYRTGKQTGYFNGRLAGTKALHRPNSQGYRAGKVLGRYVAAHRAAFALHFGRWPSGPIDHVNGDRLDNRITNIRESSKLQNNRNRRFSAAKYGKVTGVHFRNGSWKAAIGTEALGSFASEADAIAARKEAERRLGYSENHGRMM